MLKILDTEAVALSGLDIELATTRILAPISSMGIKAGGTLVPSLNAALARVYLNLCKPEMNVNDIDRIVNVGLPACEDEDCDNCIECQDAKNQCESEKLNCLIIGPDPDKDVDIGYSNCETNAYHRHLCYSNRKTLINLGS